jgi:hypothetical protein
MTTVYAEDPRSALGRFTMIDLSPLASGTIDILDEEGAVLLTRAWPLDLAPEPAPSRRARGK